MILRQKPRAARVAKSNGRIGGHRRQASQAGIVVSVADATTLRTKDKRCDMSLPPVGAKFLTGPGEKGTEKERFRNKVRIAD